MFTPRLLVGAFADYNVSSFKGSIQDQGPFAAGTIKQDSAWAAGVRGGFLLTPQVLSYGSIGYTAARFSGTTLVNTGTGAVLGSTAGFTATGWFLGGGLEAALTPNLFWRNEYRYARYDSNSIAELNAAGAPTGRVINFKPEVQTVTTQLVYKFNWLR